MKWHLSLVMAATLIAAIALGQPAAPNDPQREADLAALRQASAAFVQAFQKGDAKAVAALWTEQGEYSDEALGTFRGRAAIEKVFAEFFAKNPGSKLDLQIEAIRFLGRDSAIEDGTLTLTPAGEGTATKSRYSTLHVRENGRWLAALVREWPADRRGEVTLADLEWLVGSWAGKGKDTEFRLSYEWDESKAFLRGKFTLTEGGKVASSGTQIIGRDRSLGLLRSWMFDATGGFGEGVWLRDGNRWMIESGNTLADGKRTAAVNLLVQVSADSFTWQSMGRVAGGEPQPDTAPIKLTRVKPGS